MADPTELANRRTEQALERAGLADPRPALRDLLRELKASDPEAFAEAAARYQQVVVPAAAAEADDPLAAWLEYGSWLADRVAPGELVSIDASGRSRPPAPTLRAGELYLHLPSDRKRRALPLLVPRRPSAPQRETIGLLVG